MITSHLPAGSMEAICEIAPEGGYDAQRKMWDLQSRTNPSPRALHLIVMATWR